MSISITREVGSDVFHIAINGATIMLSSKNATVLRNVLDVALDSLACDDADMEWLKGHILSARRRTYGE